MNIYYLHENPAIAAKAMTDQHVSVMIVETAHILSMAHRVTDGRKDKRGRWEVYIMKDPVKESTFYSSSKFNDPCVRWARSSQDNYSWLYKHFLALCQENRTRFNEVHELEHKLGHLFKQYPLKLRKRGKTQPPLIMPEKYKFENNPVQSYRSFYDAEKLIKDSDKKRFMEVLEK